MTSIWTKFKVNTMISILMNENQPKDVRQDAYYHIVKIGEDALPQLNKLNEKLKKEYIELSEDMNNRLWNNVNPSIKPYTDSEYAHLKDIGNA